MLKRFILVMVPAPQCIPNHKLFFRTHQIYDGVKTNHEEVVVWGENGVVYTQSLEEVAMKSLLVCSENTLRIGG